MEQPMPGGQAAGQPPGRPGSPSGMSKLKASTRKLASKLGIGHHKKDRGRGVDTPTGGGSPRAESPMPASPAAAAIPAAGAGTTPAAVPLSPHSPVAPVTPGLEGPLQTGLEAPLQAASPLLVAGGGTESPRRLGPAEDLESARKRLARLRSVAERAAHLAPSGGAASPRATGSPRTAAQALEVEHRAHAGQAAAHLLGVPSPPVAASLPAAAPATTPGSERAATSAAQPAAGLLAPSAAERAAKPAAPPLASEPVLPAAGQRAAAPAPAHAAMAAASALEQPKQSRHRVEAAALGPEGGAAGTAQAAHPGSASERPTAAPARVASPRTPGTAAALVPAPASTEPAGGVAPHVAAPPAAAEAAAAEEKEQEMSEGLAAYRPATADTRRGRLNILVAQASPYLGPLPGTAGPAEAGSPGAQAGPGAEAGEAEETGAAAPGAWRVAADQPVAAVGGTTGTTHVGGPGELEAARLHRRAAPEAAAEAAAGAAEEGAAGGAPQRPLSPTDARKGQGLAAADVAAGHHAAVDAAAGTAGEAGVSGGAAGRAAAAPEEVQPLLQEEREAEAEARAGPQKPEAAPGEELPGLQQQREAGRAEAGPAVAGTAASAEPGSPASAPSPRPSGLAALQAESALLLEQEAALAPLGEGQEQQQAELEGSAAGPSLAMRKAEEGRPAEQAPSAGAAARVRAQREPGAEPAAEARPSEERAIGMGPALDRLPAAQELAAPLTVGRRRAPSQPLLPAGAFSQAQNVSVFSPHQPEVYEVRDQEVDLATQVLPSGAAATVGPQSELGVQLAPLAAGDEPARLEAGPFGAVEDISVLAPTGALPEEEEGEEEVLPKAPGMDRSTKEEAVDVDELAGRLMPAEREEEAAAEAPLTATATSAAQQAAATAADTGAAAKEAAASTAASAAQAARVTVERVAAMAGAAAGAVADAASRLSTGVSEKAAAAKEAAVDTAGSAAEKAATAKEAASETATQVAGTAAQATTAAKEAATGAAEAAAEKVTAAKDVATTATTIAAGTAAEAAGEGVGAAVDKAATAKQTVAAAAEQVAGATAEKGAAAKEAAAEAASATVERAQGVMAAARGEASRQVDTGRIVVQTSEAAGGRPEAAGPSVQAEIAAAEEGGGPAVEQAAAAAGEEDAVACNEAVSASLLPALEGAAEPAELSAPALPATARAMPTSPGQAAAGGGPAAAVLPVAVHKVDKEPAREAAMRSTAVDASLAVEQEAPEVGEAELAEQEAAAAAQAAGPGRTASPQRRTPTSPGAGRGPVLPVAVTAEDRQLAREAAAHSLAVDASLAAEQDAPEVGDAELEAAAATAQPEGLDATPEYLAERAEARGQSGLGAGSRLARDEEAAAAAGAGAEPAGRLQMKDISGLGGASGLAEQAPSAEGTSSGPASEGTASEPWQEPELSPTERKRAMASQFSIGGLREPPPSPTASASPAGTSSPAGGGPGDVPRPSRLAVAASALPGPVAGAAEGSRDAEPAPAAEGLGIEAEEREAAAAEGLEQAAEGVKAEAAKGLAAEASEGVETLAEAEGGGAAEAPLEGAASGSGAGLAGRALDRIDTAGSSTGETAGPEKDMQRLETGTSMDGSEAGEIEEVVIPAVITPLGRVRHMLRAAMNWVHANPVLAAGGGVVLATVLWAVLVRLAVEVLGEFGPALAMAATLAVVGTAVAWLARYVGLQEGELTMVQDPALAAPATGAGGGAAAAPKERPAAAAAGAAPAEASAPTLGEVEALPSIPGATASEPVSAESTEDLRESGGGGGSGIMQAARHAVVDAAEGAMEAVEPGREQVGEVIQETESGGEEAQEGDVLGSAVRAVTGAAAAAAHKLGALTDRAYQALRKEAPGADVSGEGAPIKSLATAPVVGEEEQRARLEPASFEPAPRPSPLPATSGGGEEPQSGYESDTEEPGPVLEGVHPAHYQPTGGQPGAEPYPPHHHHRHHHHHAGGQVQGTIVAAAEQAGTPHSHITEGTPAEEEPQGASEGPAPAAEAPAGRLGRAAEAASELAATAAGKVKHAAAVATGTAEEQRQPGQQLADLQRSIAAMEEERAGDVRFQQAGKQLGL